MDDKGFHENEANGILNAESEAVCADERCR